MFCFRVRERLGECVGGHIVSGAVDEIDGSVFDDETDVVVSVSEKVEANQNVWEIVLPYDCHFEA